MKIGTITKSQIHKAIKKANREVELDNGWKAVKRVHKSKKQYSRKPKHKSDY